MSDDAGKAVDIDIPGRSQCEIVRREGNHVEFRFSERGGGLTARRWEFKDRAEIVDYLADLLSLDVVAGGLRGTTVRRGKYERYTPDGQRCFTIGDPILDLITSPSGELVINGKSIDLSAVELSSAGSRAGGIRSIDLTSVSRAMFDSYVAQAAMGQGEFAIVECTDQVMALASINPKQRDFYHSGDHLRFKAWKKNYVFYWSMGAEIETWGHDFDFARIDSRYLDTVAQQFCAAVKVDSDSDTNDDYVDELEWGINAPQPLRVVSNCTAHWHGDTFAGQVAAGEECFEV